MPESRTDRVTTVTNDLAQWVAQSRVSDVPELVRDRARLLILDAIGCGLHGSTQDWTSIICDFAVSAGGQGESAVWGTERRVSAIMAPLVNGTAVHAFEYDDLHPQAVIHAGAQILPVAVAVAEMLELGTTIPSGEFGEPSPNHEVSSAEFLHAVIIGFEVGARVGLATGAGQLARGFHPSPNSATFAAAATASRLLRLDAEETAQAFGIAGSFGGYLMAAQYGAMVKRVHPGHSAQTGMTAALLASRGLTGAENVLESRYGGFASTYSDTDTAATEAISQGLGATWEIPNFSFKVYPCCGSNHTAIDAWWAIQRTGELKADDIDQIEVRCSSLTADHVGWSYAPGSVTTAQMNLTYCLAVAITDGRVTVDQFRADRLADPVVLGMADRIRVITDPTIDELGRARRHRIELRIGTHDGRQLSQECEFPRGSAGNPVPPAEVVHKFRNLARERLEEDQIAQIERSIFDLGTELHGGFSAEQFTRLLVPRTQFNLTNEQ